MLITYNDGHVSIGPKIKTIAQTQIELSHKDGAPCYEEASTTAITTFHPQKTDESIRLGLR